VSNTPSKALDLSEFQKASDKLFEQGWHFLSAGPAPFHRYLSRPVGKMELTFEPLTFGRAQVRLYDADKGKLLEVQVDGPAALMLLAVEAVQRHIAQLARSMP
jgi:hypothetical protein